MADPWTRDADRVLRFEHPQDDAGFGFAWPDHFFAGSSAVSAVPVTPVAHVAPVAPVAPVLDILKFAEAVRLHGPEDEKYSLKGALTRVEA